MSEPTPIPPRTLANIMKHPPEYSASRGNNYAYWVCGCETVASPLVTDDDIMSLCMYHKGYWAAEKEEISGREYFERVTRPVEMTEEAEAVVRELLPNIDFTKFPDDLLTEELVSELGLPDSDWTIPCQPWRLDADGKARFRVADIAKAAAMQVEQGQAVLKALGVA